MPCDQVGEAFWKSVHKLQHDPYAGDKGLFSIYAGGRESDNSFYDWTWAKRTGF